MLPHENASDGIIAINPTGELEPYEYSIDGGMSFVDNNTFADLAPGTYMIVVRYISGVCFYEETVELEFDVVNNTADIAAGGIKLYPNPTEENLIIEIDDDFDVDGVVKIEIFDCLGRLIKRDSVSKSETRGKAIISLKEYVPGSYFVRCYNQNFERNFKVVKI